MRNTRMHRFLPVLTTLLLFGCVVAPAPNSYPPAAQVEVIPPPNPYPSPPPPRVEVVPPPPRETVVWEPGRWHWDGHGYVWVNGHYVERLVGRHWQTAQWAWDGHNWVWVGGHWAS
jgi:hypothetical protein